MGAYRSGNHFIESLYSGNNVLVILLSYYFSYGVENIAGASLRSKHDSGAPNSTFQIRISHRFNRKVELRLQAFLTVGDDSKLLHVSDNTNDLRRHLINDYSFTNWIRIGEVLLC